MFFCLERKTFFEEHFAKVYALCERFWVQCDTAFNRAAVLEIKCSYGILD